MSGLRTVHGLLELGERVLNDSTHLFDEHDHRDEAERLLAHVLKTEPDRLKDADEVDPRRRDRFLALIARRAGGEPFPFLVGYIDFYGLHLRVARGTFIPRPSSELTVERAVHRLKRRRKPVVVDVCAGIGPIAMGIADDVPNADVWSLDISPEAVRQGRRNARELGMDNVTFRVSDMYDGLPASYENSVDLITGHVPYVPLDEVEDLPTEVVGHEPVHTLTDHSHDGLYLMRRAVSEAPRWLKPGGWLLLEMSHDRPRHVKPMVRKAGLDFEGLATDDDDLSVILEAQKPFSAN